MSDYERSDTMVVEALRRANPVPSDFAASPRSRPSAHALFADIVEQRPRRVRRRVLVLIVVIALTAALLMAFVALRRVGTSLSTAPVCYQADSLESQRVVATAGDAKQACAALWTSGRFGSAVPDFDVCVLPSGALGVFPGEAGSVCSQLDLPESSGDNRIERFVDALNRRITASCVPPDQAKRIAEKELASRGLTNWTVTAGEADAKHPCASVSPHTSERTIVLIPIKNPRPDSVEEP
jgi:hypothetical protein